MADRGENGAYENDYSGLSVDISYYQDEGFDDIVDFVTTDYLASLTSEDNSSGSDDSGATISFENDMSDFDESIQETNNSLITVNADTGTVSVAVGGGEKDYGGCLWYSGSADDTCSDGVCVFNSTLRAYFSFEFNHQGGDDGGFTFAVITSENNDNPCGSGSDANMGYSGNLILHQVIITTILIIPN